MRRITVKTGDGRQGRLNGETLKRLSVEKTGAKNAARDGSCSKEEGPVLIFAGGRHEEKLQCISLHSPL